MEANAALAKAASSELFFTQDHWLDVCDLIDATKANYGVRAKVELTTFDRVTNEFVSVEFSGAENPCVDVLNEQDKELPLPGTFYVGLTYPVLIEKVYKINGNQVLAHEIATLRLWTWM